MTPPRVFQVPRSLRISNRIGIAVLGSIGLACAAAAVWANFGADPAPARVVFGVMAFFFGGLATGLFGKVRLGDRSYSLREDGIEILSPNEMPTFVGWGQIVRLRFSKLGKGFDLLGAADHPLGRIDASIEGLGELLNVIVRKAVVPKAHIVIPWRAEKQYSAPMVAVFVLAGLACLASAVGLGQQGKLLPALIFPAFFGLAWLIESLSIPRAVVVDRDGVRLHRALSTKAWSWAEVEGASLAVLRGDKGALSLGAALLTRDGKWEILRIPGVDPAKILAAISTSDPRRVIAGPDRISLFTGRPFGGSGSSIKGNVTWKVEK